VPRRERDDTGEHEGGAVLPGGSGAAAGGAGGRGLRREPDAASVALRVDRSTLHRLLNRDQLRSDAADRIAVTLGRHPSELWPDWFADEQVSG
jgi:lambda repressor-like predicted transcriptional regulator